MGGHQGGPNHQSQQRTVLPLRYFTSPAFPVVKCGLHLNQKPGRGKQSQAQKSARLPDWSVQRGLAPDFKLEVRSFLRKAEPVPQRI